tara:strand:+ start:2856 stop:3110 length:255 start_codon:yes stop_codon:yes gene_type:complete
MKNETKNSVAKAMEPGGPTLVAEKDPLHNIDLDLMNALKEAFDEAVKDGFKGDQRQWQDSLSLGELKRLGAKNGGLINMSMTKS